jgi:hypothetical protein
VAADRRAAVIDLVCQRIDSEICDRLGIYSEIAGHGPAASARTSQPCSRCGAAGVMLVYGKLYLCHRFGCAGTHQRVRAPREPDLFSAWSTCST